MDVSAEWDVFDYEFTMARVLCNQLAPERFSELSPILQAAVVESLVLHTRILADILLSKKGGTDDITLQELLPGFSSPSVAELSAVYGTQGVKESPCWQFNKLLAHPTTNRITAQQCLPALTEVWTRIGPLIVEIADARVAAGN